MLREIKQEALASFLVEGDDNLIGEESKVEHYVFPWTIKGFLSESLKASDLTFRGSNKDRFRISWQLDLSLRDSHDDIQICLTRLSFQHQALVFVRFRWEILDANGNKVFPGSIHALAYPDDKLYKVFVEIDQLLEDSPRFLPDGDLHIFCELTAYERTVEERISAKVKENIPYALNGLTDDLEKLFFTGYGADMRVSSVDGTMYCHKSILSVRSSAFAQLIEAVQSDDCHLHLGEFKGDVLHAILTHLYLGHLDMYLEHAIPKDLYSVATEYGLKHLQEHLDHVNSNGLTMLKSLDVTWKLPHFKRLILQPKVALYCPEQNTSTLYDKRWCFKLEFSSSSDGVDISVVRKQEGDTQHCVKFVVRIEQYGQITSQRTETLTFEADGAQGIEAFKTKNELMNFLSFQDCLVLKCSLEVVKCVRGSSGPKESRLKTLVENISSHAEESLLKMAEDLRRMYVRSIFSDEVVNTKLGRIDYHSFIAWARFGLLDCEFKEFAASLNPHLVQAFFLFLYGGDAERYKALGIQQVAELRHVPKIVEKIKEFLVFYQA